MLSNDDSKTYARPSESDVLGEGLGICLSIYSPPSVQFSSLKVSSQGTEKAVGCVTGLSLMVKKHLPLKPQVCEWVPPCRRCEAGLGEQSGGPRPSD